MEDTNGAIICYNLDLDELEKLMKEHGSNRLCLIDGKGLEDKLINNIVNNELKDVDDSDTNLSRSNSFIIFHNVDGKTINDVIKNIRLKGKSCVFATTTETNLNWTLKELLSELIQEHKRFGH
ncbi:MAG: DUF3783 domain-containing protein [Thermotogota bacterium]|nr:DUF3783 domain-containing protein [Thermotogota bacterium]